MPVNWFTGEGQVHGHIELAVRTLIQGGADHIGGPDVPLLVLHFGQHHIVKGILGNQLPPHRLFEGAASVNRKTEDLSENKRGKNGWLPATAPREFRPGPC